MEFIKNSSIHLYPIFVLKYYVSNQVIFLEVKSLEANVSK